MCIRDRISMYKFSILKLASFEDSRLVMYYTQVYTKPVTANNLYVKYNMECYRMCNTLVECLPLQLFRPGQGTRQTAYT